MAEIIRLHFIKFSAAVFVALTGLRPNPSLAVSTASLEDGELTYRIQAGGIDARAFGTALGSGALIQHAGLVRGAFEREGSFISWSSRNGRFVDFVIVRRVDGVMRQLSLRANSKGMPNWIAVQSLAQVHPASSNESTSDTDCRVLRQNSFDELASAHMEAFRGFLNANTRGAGPKCERSSEARRELVEALIYLVPRAGSIVQCMERLSAEIAEPVGNRSLSASFFASFARAINQGAVACTDPGERSSASTTAPPRAEAPRIRIQADQPFNSDSRRVIREELLHELLHGPIAAQFPGAQSHGFMRRISRCLRGADSPRQDGGSGSGEPTEVQRLDSELDTNAARATGAVPLADRDLAQALQSQPISDTALPLPPRPPAPALARTQPPGPQAEVALSAAESARATDGARAITATLAQVQAEAPRYIASPGSDWVPQAERQMDRAFAQAGQVFAAVGEDVWSRAVPVAQAYESDQRPSARQAGGRLGRPTSQRSVSRTRPPAGSRDTVGSVEPNQGRATAPVAPLGIPFNPRTSTPQAEIPTTTVFTDAPRRADERSGVASETARNVPVGGRPSGRGGEDDDTGASGSGPTALSGGRSSAAPRGSGRSSAAARQTASVSREARDPEIEYEEQVARATTDRLNRSQNPATLLQDRAFQRDLQSGGIKLILIDQPPIGDLNGPITVQERRVRGPTGERRRFEIVRDGAGI